MLGGDLMKAYLMTTGTIFGLLVVVHVWRATEEGHLATDPAYVLLTAAAAGLCLWAVRLLRLLPRP